MEADSPLVASGDTITLKNLHSQNPVVSVLGSQGNELRDFTLLDISEKVTVSTRVLSPRSLWLESDAFGNPNHAVHCVVGAPARREVTTII